MFCSSFNFQSSCFYHAYFNTKTSLTGLATQPRQRFFFSRNEFMFDYVCKYAIFISVGHQAGNGHWVN